jgi:hypothetical protein
MRTLLVEHHGWHQLLQPQKHAVFLRTDAHRCGRELRTGR